MWLAEFYYKKIKKVDVPYYVRYSLTKIISKPIRKIFIHDIIPNCPFNGLRVKLYRMAGFNIGKNVFIGMKCYIDDMEPRLITIEDNVSVSFEVCIVVHGVYQKCTPIVIRKDAYIGCRTTILSGKKGINIGEHAVVGACSFVNKNIPENEIWAGVPVKKIGLVDPCIPNKYIP